MKTPINMLEDIAAQISEGATLLKSIYRNAPDNEEIDCSVACLIRSFEVTLETAYKYIEQLPPQHDTPPGGNNADISDDVFYATVSAAKLRELVHVYNESYFAGKDSDDSDCLMASLIFDNAIKTHELLQKIETKLS
ncbi:hypothetical protein ACVQMG_000526 [Enterobacter roggenkampii]